MKTVVVIQGPTASGKTAVAVRLARELGTAIVSADSRQCYEGMPIGTAWPSPTELGAVKHYFIGEYPVTTHLTAADYERIALSQLGEIFTRHDTAVVCGGTGLYIKSLCEGLDEMPPIDETIKGEVNLMYKKLGLEWLQKAVQHEDPEFFASGEIHNPSRLLRALVFVRSNGRSILSFRTSTRKPRPFRIVKVGLDLPRAALYERINKRVDLMMDAGLLAEVTSLFHQRHLKNLQTVGYSELFDYLEGNCTLPEAIDKIKQHTRNYAKRQLTWFKKDADIVWLSPDDGQILEKIKGLLSSGGAH